MKVAQFAEPVVATTPANDLRHRPSQQFYANEFLSAITHELKTPLNAILGFTNILQGEILNPQSQKECLNYADDIMQVALDMNELIHDLLDVTQIFSGNFSVDLSKEINIEDVIKRSLRLNHDYSLARNISIKTEISDNVGLINLDAKRMKQVLSNLISNAIKYSHCGSEIKIICQKTYDNFLEISVTDQGFGMTPKQTDLAFQKYQTIPNPNSGAVDSFGLGLPITKHLVELQGGTIEVKSKINCGTEMKLRFPFR